MPEGAAAIRAGASWPLGHKVEAASNKVTKGASDSLYPLLNSGRQEVL